MHSLHGGGAAASITFSLTLCLGALGCTPSTSSGAGGGGGSTVQSSSSASSGGGAGGGTAQSSSSASAGGGGAGGATTSSSASTGGAACVPVDDGNACTDDVCVGGAPVSVPVAAGSPCSMGGTECDGVGTCFAPACNGLLGLPGVPTLSVGYTPISVVAADLDGDGKLDLAVANRGSGTVSVLLGLGNGVFAPAVDYPTGATATSVVTLDVNGDGQLDLAVASVGVAVLINQGNGIFGAPIHYNAGTGIGNDGTPSALVTADLDGDGRPDLAVAGGWMKSVSVLLNQGNGTFAPTVYYDTMAETTAIAVGDLNGDGHPDLAVGHLFNFEPMSVLFNQGNGSFAAPVDVSAEPAGAIAIADLNGDSKLDLVVTDYGGKSNDNVEVLLNQGNGLFNAPVAYAVEGGTAYVDPASIAVVDLDGDGKLDLAVAHQDELSELVNQGNGIFAPAVTIPSSPYPSAVAAADLNGDGKPDLAIANGFSGTVSVLLNPGNGAFVNPVNLPEPLGGARMVATADFDGDGTPDLVGTLFGTDAVGVVLNPGNGILGAPVAYPAGANPTSVAALDLNGDDEPDLAVTNDDISGNNGSGVSVLLNQGNGTFAAPIHHATGAGPISVAALDLNGDGKPDLAVANRTSGDVSVLLNQGNGTFAAAINYAAGAGPASIAALDFDGDGKPDLAVANDVVNGTVSVLLNQGNGTFAAAVSLAAGLDPVWVAAQDLNGDGKADLAVVSYSQSTLAGSAVSVLLNQGNGTFAAPVEYPLGTEAAQVVVADLNGDGHLDLAVTSPVHSVVSVLLNHGNGTFAAAVTYGESNFSRAIAAADLNGDGRIDLFVPSGPLINTGCLP